MNFLKGNLLELAPQFDIIAHGACCMHIMEAGIAKQIAKIWPEVLEVDINQTGFGDVTKIGTYTFVSTSVLNQPLKIYNLYTQFHSGPNFEYAALAMSMFAMCMNEIASPNIRIGVPLIGGGIGHGDRAEIIRIMQHVERNFRKAMGLQLVPIKASKFSLTLVELP